MTMKVVNAGVTYHRLGWVAPAATSTDAAATAYTPSGGDVAATPAAVKAPTATDTTRPTLRRRCISATGRITSRAAATCHPTWSRSRANPIAAAVAPARPRRTP